MVCTLAVEATKGCAGRARRLYAAALAGARAPLRCSASWPAPKLAALTSFALLKQWARVRCGSARVRARPGALALQPAPSPRAWPLARHEQSTGLFVSGRACSAPHVRAAPCPHSPLRHRLLCSKDLKGARRCPQGRGREPGGAHLRRRVAQATRPSSAEESGPQGPTAANKPRRAPARGLARAARRGTTANTVLIAHPPTPAPREPRTSADPRPSRCSC
jgi:hypothetical protein